MRVSVNGDDREMPPGTTIAALVDALQPGRRRGIAVAVDGVVVRRAEWEAREVHDGAQVELVTAVQGG